MFVILLPEDRKKMQPFPATIVLRHRRENLKKCSLNGLETRDDLIFFTYPKDKVSCENMTLLTLGAPPITLDDQKRGLFLIDATWALADKMFKMLPKTNVVYRSIPRGFKTAYPRRQQDCLDPLAGLASVEALFIAYHLLGRDKGDLLNHYYWKDQFLKLNQNLF